MFVRARLASGDDSTSPHDWATMQPILPTGDRLTEDTENSSFTDRNRSVSCLISVNGNNAFSAHAQFHDIEDTIEWRKEGDRLGNRSGYALTLQGSRQLWPIDREIP
ncbi:hypothetical protein OHA57_30795 [Streptomyces anulatus]|nr:hypothetical protein [Streptomyces anulatus]WSC64881.1 hypothetical protein OHA57_30795 [Streptomyces anulatus]